MSRTRISLIQPTYGASLSSLRLGGRPSSQVISVVHCVGVDLEVETSVLEGEGDVVVQEVRIGLEEAFPASSRRFRSQ